MLQIWKRILCVVVSVAWLLTIASPLRAEEERSPKEKSPAKKDAASSPTKPTSPEVSQSQKPSPPDDPALQEILQLRKLHGSVLKGSLLEKIATEGADAATSADPFVETLRRLANENPAPPATVTSPVPVPPLPQPPEAPQNFLPNLTLSDQHFILSLRSASRALEVRANEHEDAGDYEAADRLRGLADQLRREARTKHPALPKATSP